MPDHKPSYQKYRRRERIRTRFVIQLVVYACIIGALGYFVVEFLREYQQVKP